MTAHEQVPVRVLREYPRGGKTYPVGSLARIPAYALESATSANPPFVERVTEEEYAFELGLAPRPVDHPWPDVPPETAVDEDEPPGVADPSAPPDPEPPPLEADEPEDGPA